ncbi:matrix-remodeling-associated protein 5 [Pseudophryne corroboree]|uniref:matrix-remodeling-associated protein 5 n=1 Tax=Pseudophryne corroboree TaxID=495146 RepID=UPI00308168F6
MKTLTRMYYKTHLWLLPAIVIFLRLPHSSLSCPHPCACYVNSEVHCTFRSLATVPTRIPKHVERINLGFNSIQFIPENAFSGLSKLEMLLIHSNDVQNIPNGAFKDLSSLQVFKMSYNKLKVINSHTFHGLFGLTRLHVDHNKIGFIHPNAFNGLIALRLLHLEGNLLQQIHANTFCTFNFLGYFRQSTLKHLYLSDNMIQTLPAAMIKTIPLLENLYLHGNPWACDCQLKWLLEWDEQSNGVLKCKKDRSYENGQLCPMCSTPRHLQNQEIQSLKDMSCVRPTISSPMRINSSDSYSDDDDDDDDVNDLQLLELNNDFLGQIVLNMSDEHGNKVNLDCQIKKTEDFSKMNWNQLHAEEIDINMTFVLDFECPMTRDNYERLWKLIAYYSEVPVKLERELLFTDSAKLTYRYKQNLDHDSYYYTGVRAVITAEPEWVMQNIIKVQLNRRMSTAKKVTLSFSTQLSQSLHTKHIQYPKSSWVMINRNEYTKTSYSVVKGSVCQLNCNVKSSETPTIEWSLPDGTILKAPHSDQDSKYSISANGQLIIKAADFADSGVYHCIAQVKHETDTLPIRVMVQPSANDISETNIKVVTKTIGEPISLACNAFANPDADVNWILPNNNIINSGTNKSGVYFLTDGSLLIPNTKLTNTGLYRCIAINQYGTDLHSVQVTILKKFSEHLNKVTIIKKYPVVKLSKKPKYDVIDDDRGSGERDIHEETDKYYDVENRRESGKNKGSSVTRNQGNRKDRVKTNSWKNTEKDKDSNIAEGRRKFDSRRRINVGNKQIDPKQWASILAKVRGRNVQKTTEIPHLTIPRATTAPTFSHKATTSPSITEPPLNIITESSNNMEEASADEDDLLFITSSPKITIRQYQDITTLADHRVSSTTNEESDDYSEVSFAEEIQEQVTTEPPVSLTKLTTVNPLISTLENFDEEHSIYSTDEEEVYPFTEIYNAETEITDPTKNIQTYESDHIPGQVTIKPQQEHFSDKHFSSVEVQTIPSEYDVETDENEAKVPTPNYDIIHHATDEESTVIISTQFASEYPTSDYNDQLNSMNLYNDNLIYVTEKLNTNTYPSYPTKISITGHDQMVSKAIERIIPKPSSSTVTPLPTIAATTYVDPILSSPMEEEPADTSKDYIYPTENVLNTNTDKNHDTKTFSVDIKQLLLTTIRSSHTIKSPIDKLRTVTSTPPGTIKTTPIISQTLSSTTPLLTHGYIQYPRRRNQGRRKFRPNRPRHRQNQIFPTVSSRQNAYNIITQNPVHSTTDEDKTTKALANQENTLYQTSKMTHPSTILEPTESVPLLTVENDTLIDIPATTPTATKILELPLAPPVTTTDIAYIYADIDSTKELYTLKPTKDAITTHHIQTTRDRDGTTNYTKDFNAQDTTMKYIASTPPSWPETYKLPESENKVDTEVHLSVETEPSPVLLTEEPMLTTQTTTTSNFMKYINYVQKNIAKQTMSTSTEHTTQKPTTPVYRDETKHRIIHVYSGNKGSLWRPLDEKITPNPGKYMTMSPITMNTFAPTTHFHSTSPSTRLNMPIQHSILKRIKDQDAINQVVPTRATKILQANTLSSRLNELDTYSSNQNKMFSQSKQDHFKNNYGSKLNNSLFYNAKHPQQPRVVNNYHHAIAPPYYNPVRGTIRSPYIGTHGPLRYYTTNQPFSITNKPEITAYTAQNFQERKTSIPNVPTTTPATTTTTVIPLFRPRPVTPNKFIHGQRISPNYRQFGNNFITDGKGTSFRIPYQGNPYYVNQRVLYHLNRTRPFQFPGTPKTSPLTISLVKENNKVWTTPINTNIRTTTSTSTSLATTTPTYNAQTRMTLQGSTAQPYWYYLNVNPRLRPPTSKEDSTLPPSIRTKLLENKPRIMTTGIHFVSVPYEMDAVFPCETIGEPKPLITWTKLATGAMMSSNTKIQRFKVFDNGTLHIQKLQLQDHGQYMCTAQNTHGVDKMTVTLAVVAQQPKMLLPRFKDTLIYLGDTITMDCNASGIPPPHISWILPDRKIIQTISTTESRITLFANGSLSTKEVTFPDRGIYKCIASNVAGADSLTVKLQVSPLPPIIQQEKVENISLPQSHSIFIHCSAKGAPPPTIRWVLSDGTQVRPSQFANGNLFVFPNGTLYIRNTSPKDIGKYECIAANVVGAARRLIHLDVKKYPLNAKITSSSPQKTDVSYGGTLRLDCSAAGDPWPRIMWRLPSKRLVDSFFSFDSRIKTFANGTLIIYTVTEKDAGDYLCMARNKLGDDYLVLKVNVMMKPAKIQYKNDADHKVIYGGDLKVDCVATGVPNPEISWSLPDGSMINNIMQSDDSGTRSRRYVVFNNGTLFLNEIGMKEEGDYTCYAVNQIGQDEMRVSVKVVAEKAVIKNKTYSVINVPYGDVITVSCEAKGEPIPRITWLSPANRPIPSSSEKYQIYRDGTLLIQKAQRSDSGNYTCLAQNNGGEDKKVVYILVNVIPPKINGYSNKIMSIKESAMKDTRLLIDCKSEGIPTPRVMWAFPEGVILPAPYYGNRITVHRNGTLDIKVVRKTDSVQLVCIGRNEGGEAKLNVQLTVTEPAVKPHFNSDNGNVVVAEGQSVKLNCSAVGSPQPETIWILPNGTEIRSGNHLHRMFHQQDGTLHIGTTAVGDGGTYRCRAVNIAGSADSLVTLQIGRKPQINNNYNNLVSIINGETLQLYCTTQGETRPHISWTLPNGMVIDGPQVKGRISLLQNGSLVVRDTSVYDRGSYQCKATTEYGSSTMNVPVIVIAYPPRITTSPAPVIYTRPGSSVQLNCMSIGIPKAEITWQLPDKSYLTSGAQSRLYGNKFLHPQGTLVIQHSSKRDAGYYKCTAKNILGSDTKTTYIHIY